MCCDRTHSPVLMPPRFIITQPDLDTCLTAVVLGLPPDAEIVVAQGGASEADLADPAVTCIEAGGSGDTARNNWDHHDPGGPTEAACRQAFAARGGDDAMARLVDYVALVDTRPGETPRIPFPSLSALFSGLRLAVPDLRAQFAAGVSLLRAVWVDGLDPFGTLPERPEWLPWLDAKRQNLALLDDARARARIVATARGTVVGAVESEAFGAVGLLYEMGCAIAVVLHPRFGTPPVRKLTVAGSGVRVDWLRPALDAHEPGWGGPATGTILGSPRAGTALTLDEVVDLVVTGEPHGRVTARLGAPTTAAAARARGAPIRREARARSAAPPRRP